MSDVNIRYGTGTDEEREEALAMAALSIQRGDLIVIPTDTVYGLAADAFDSDAVEDLLAAKGRGREMPPPVLVSSATTLDALAVRVPDWARALADRYWPGALTLVLHQQTSLQWDLGDTRGTVAIRMPDHAIAREILERTGPLAVSSANLTGRAAATDADQAEEMLGEDVAAIIDDGPSPGGEASTIVDATGDVPRVLREGALSNDDLDLVLRPLGLALSGEPPEDEIEAPVDEDEDADADEDEDADADEAETETAQAVDPVDPVEPVEPVDAAEPVSPVAEPKPPVKRAPAKKTPAAKTAASRTTATKVPGTKAPAKRTAPTRTPASRTTTKRAPVKRTPAAPTRPTDPAADPAADPEATTGSAPDPTATQHPEV